jgi:hypothetical protein
VLLCQVLISIKFLLAKVPENQCSGDISRKGGRAGNGDFRHGSGEAGRRESRKAKDVKLVFKRKELAEKWL